MRDRALAWDGCLNVRDLGGHPTEDGGETRFGSVVRADSVRELSAEGWRALVDYGITRIVDLRQHSELEADPPMQIPVELVHVPLFPEPGSAQWAAIGAVGEAAADSVAATSAVYLECLERFGPQVGAALAAVGNADGGGVVVHCSTGLVSALLLRLAGVSRDAVGADYALTEENLRDAWSGWVEQAADDDERERRQRLAAAPAEAMTVALAEIEARYGTVRAYLRAAGATEEELDLVLARLRA